MGNRAFTPTQRRAIVDLLVERDGLRCTDPACLKPEVHADDRYAYQVDHVDPGLPKPALNALPNLRLLCASCNGRNGALRRQNGLPSYGQGGVTRTYIGVGERTRVGVDPNKIESDEAYDLFENRAVLFVEEQDGRADYDEVMLVASYRIVRPQTAARYMKQATSRAGPLRLKMDDDKTVEIRPEHERWKP